MEDMEAVLKNTRILDEDTELARECRQGSREAFNRLVYKYQDRIYSIALRMMQNTEEAKDIAQDVFFSVYKSIKRFRGDSKLATWLYRIAVNACINKLKSKSRKQTQPIEETSPAKMGEAGQEGTTSSEISDPHKALERKDLGQKIEGELAKLPPESRIVVLLRDVQGMSYEEIEKILGIPDGTVKSRLHRARLELKKRLKKIL